MSEAQSVPGNQPTAYDLTAFQYNILVILSREPMYGLAIKRRLEDYYGAEVNHGRLYPNLDELVERGFIDKGELDKRTNQYELSEEGYEVVTGQLTWIFSNLVTNEERATELKGQIDHFVD